MVEQVNARAAWLWLFCQTLETTGVDRVTDRLGRVWTQATEHWETRGGSGEVYMSLPGIVAEYGPIVMADETIECGTSPTERHEQ
jgi:hypothetical protein